MNGCHHPTKNGTCNEPVVWIVDDETGDGLCQAHHDFYGDEIPGREV